MLATGVVHKYSISLSSLKIAFPMFQDLYLNFVLIRHGKVTDMKTTAFERRVYYSQFPRKGDMPHHEPGGRRSEGSVGKPLLTVVQTP